jgi:ribose 5-phosphate isomerase B
MSNWVIASDHAGVALKAALIDWLLAKGERVDDLGVHTPELVDYPDQADLVVRALRGKCADRGILICGTGIGMSMRANRFKGIRAAVVYSVETAELVRQHNDANILCLGARVTPIGTALACLEAFRITAFIGDRYIKRNEKLEGPTT